MVYTHVLYYSLPIQHITVPWVHTRDNQHRRKQLLTRFPGLSFKTVGYGSASCWGDLGAGSVEADVFYIPFIVSVQYIGY